LDLVELIENDDAPSQTCARERGIGDGGAHSGKISGRDVDECMVEGAIVGGVVVVGFAIIATPTTTTLPMIAPSTIRSSTPLPGILPEWAPPPPMPRSRAHAQDGASSLSTSST